ncbi:hypothetical protein D1632_13730 [Chryseobacterium nematophagum]|uniref:Signal peptidase n=1 Tax=Chryseobacterium nematophagum TaxID=2305228 RepID=A0A3M7LAU9_9FLAO|nr:hypothetical protein [Chryseobacterium nematophagum]RMZ58652.1 hypothetical protein D1632_13730 [Chryseobacterium nematophagum]
MKKMVLTLSMVASVSMYAQDDADVPAEPGDPARIDMYISALYCIGVGMATYCIIKKSKKNTSV